MKAGMKGTLKSKSISTNDTAAIIATETMVLADSLFLLFLIFLLTRYDLYLAFAVHIFFHPDYTVGFGVSPNQPKLADSTASRDFHSALKIQTLFRGEKKASCASLPFLNKFIILPYHFFVKIKLFILKAVLK